MNQMTDDNCMNCKRRKATISEGKARWCESCRAFLNDSDRQSRDREPARRRDAREPDYYNRNAPGGAWDHSDR